MTRDDRRSRGPRGRDGGGPPRRKPPHDNDSQRGGDSPGGRRSASRIGVRRVDQEAWILLHPRCADERADDLEEVQKMIDGGETEIAVDELRWLLAGCGEMLAAHRLLGELALGQEDWQLARAHFGIAFELGVKASRAIDGTLPYRLEPNRDFHESGKGLMWCLKQLGRDDLVGEVRDQLLRLDPSDPLNVKGLGGKG